jgi:HK97 family phage prohead protease
MERLVEKTVRQLFLVNRAAAAPPTDEGATFVASTAASDRYGDVVDQSWKLDSYKQNPVIQVDHDYRAESTVGRAEEAAVEDGALVVKVKWGSDPKSKEIAAKVKDGLLSAVSVGFRPGRAARRSELPADHPYYADAKSNPYGMVFYDNELLEVSVVAVPANPEALAQRAAPSTPALSDGDMQRIADAVLLRLASAQSLSAPAPKAAPVPTSPNPDSELARWLAGGN